MKVALHLSLHLSLLFTLACSHSRALETPEPLDTPETLGVMAQCLSDGGELLVVDEIDNNDTREHGPILTFDVSPERRLAVSSEDGTLKFWSLDAFEGEVGLNQITYGPELAVEARRLAFVGEEVVSGDSRGAVLLWDQDGSMSVVGGAEPGNAIEALALDEETGFLAHYAGATLVRRFLPGFEGEVAQVELEGVVDLLFAHNRLFVLRTDSLEIRDLDSLALEQSTALAGGSRLRTAGTKVLVVADDVRLFEADLTPVGQSDTPGVVDALYIDGHVLALAAADGGSRVSTGDASLSLADEPVSMVMDPDGELAFVATAGGLVHLVACTPR